MITTKRLISSLIISAGALVTAPLALGQTGTDVSAGDWPEYGGNMGAQRY